ncbi:MAG: hypothetical protein HFG77_07425 [Hungatella sp.]|nr:hypothetical protein [Dorea sp.]MCI9636212.1 hypothetical protein [Hungatella sp.]
MAEKKTTAKDTGIILKPVEEWKRQHKVKDAVFEGIKAANGWRNGKQVAEKEFEAAKDAFIHGAADGR